MRIRLRIVEFDGLRTVAIFGVMLFHFSPRLPCLGWAGVDLFFVISGFLITGILLDLRSASTPYRKFYWRRVIRIFPPCYTVLAIIAVLAFAEGDIGNKSAWLPVLFFLPAVNRGFSIHLMFNRLTGRTGFDTLTVMTASVPFWSHYIEGILPYWSLAVEELFYLLWAPIILKCSRRTIMVLAIAPLVVCPLIRGLTHTYAFPEYFGLVPRFDSLAVGGCLALLMKARPEISAWKMLAPMPLLLAALVWLSVYCGGLRGVEIRSTEMYSIFGYSLLALLFGNVVAICVRWSSHPMLAPLRFGPIAYLGTISYTMYLVHIVAYVMLSRVLSGELLRTIAAIVFTIGVAAVSWKYFETPILRLKNWELVKRQTSMVFRSNL